MSRGGLRGQPRESLVGGCSRGARSEVGATDDSLPGAVHEFVKQPVVHDCGTNVSAKVKPRLAGDALRAGQHKLMAFEQLSYLVLDVGLVLNHRRIFRRIVTAQNGVQLDKLCVVVYVRIGIRI